VARFNQAMLQDAALGSPQSWRLEAVSENALAISVTAMVLAPAHPALVLLRTDGGAGDYVLSVAGARAADGVAIDPAFASVPVAIARAGDAEMTVRLFDSVWGPLGVAQRPTRRRTVDQLVANRALALGVQQQLAQRLGLGGSAGGDGRPGARRG
jgi:hypothetical protein